MLIRLFCSFDVVSGLGIDDDAVPFVDEEGSVDLGACVELDDLGAAGGGVTLDAGRSFDDFELHLDGQVYVYNIVIPAQSLQNRVGLEEFGLVADEFRGQFEAFRWIFGIGEPIFITVVVEEFDLLTRDISFLEDVGLGEVAFQMLARQKISEFGLYDRTALLHLQVMRFQDHTGLVLEYEIGFRPQVIYS